LDSFLFVREKNMPLYERDGWLDLELINDIVNAISLFVYLKQKGEEKNEQIIKSR
jgi:hypothetical protein